MLLDILLLIVALIVTGGLFLPRLRRSDVWRATVTPLASIIGSGFLVVAPLVGHAAGVWAPLAMVAIVLLAYAVGRVVRFNIEHVEPALERGTTAARVVERLSNLALSAAYVISVAFYVRLLASFVLEPFGQDASLRLPDVIASAVLLGIGVIGVVRGLGGLEWLEESAVNIKLGIIAALLIGLAWFDAGWLLRGQSLALHPIADHVEALRLLGGMLLVVQGFETSRYLGAAYSPDLRIRTMRYAQWIAGGIYVVFVCLALPLLGSYGAPPSDTAIIDISRQAASVLPPMLVFAAVMSQLSAAIADTVGSGGILEEASRSRLPLRLGYAVVVALATALIWTADIFAIIAIASRAFAFYYLVQCMAAWLAAGRIDDRRRRLGIRGGVTVLGLLLALVVVFAIPPEAG